MALFSNIQDSLYWSSTEYAPSPLIGAWFFNFHNGLQNANFKGIQTATWAVRSGDVPSAPSPATIPNPEPSTMLLLGSGVVGLIGYRIKKAQA